MTSPARIAGCDSGSVTHQNVCQRARAEIAARLAAGFGGDEVADDGGERDVYPYTSPSTTVTGFPANHSTGAFPKIPRKSLHIASGCNRLCHA